MQLHFECANETLRIGLLKWKVLHNTAIEALIDQSQHVQRVSESFRSKQLNLGAAKRGKMLVGNWRLVLNFFWLVSEVAWDILANQSA